MACDPDTLMAEANCIMCKIPPNAMDAVEVSLLCTISGGGDSGGGGGGGSSVSRVLCGSGAPTTDPSITTVCWFYLDTDTDNLWYWNSAQLTWKQLIG